jgi:hypothetical protein
MSVHVTLGLGPGGPVAIKTATGAESIERLRAEAARLRRAGHPGVVTVVNCDPAGQAVELRTRFAGDALSRWSGSLAGAAGLCVAIADTLADLHDVGLVHGRLDASHVLVGSDGRPRLCGLSDPGDAEPADDVRAFGVLMEDLLAQVEARRRGTLAWPRAAGSGGDRRALAQAARRALDPVAARRPSARVLARSILAAVPGAELPPPSAPLSVSGGADGLGPWLTPTDDWPPAVARPFTSGSTASASSASSASSGSPGGSASSGPSAGRLSGKGIPPANGSHAAVGADNEVGASGGDPESLRNDAGLTAERPPPDTPAGDESGAMPVGAATTGGDGGAATERGQSQGKEGPSRDVPWSVSGPAGPDIDRTDPLGWLHDETDDQPVTAPVRAVTRPSPLPRLGETRFRAGASDEAGRPRRPSGRRRRPRRGRAAALGIGSACVVGLTVIAGGAVATRANTSSRDATQGATGAARPDQCPTAPPPAADVDGDGCAEVVRVDGRVVEAGGARWSLGEPGDVATVGDWDCDGTASPALLRPATGAVFVFTRWAADGEAVTVDAVDTVAGGGTAVRASRNPAGCDALVVERPSGDVVVEVDR